METMLSNIYEEKEVLLKILKEFRERMAIVGIIGSLIGIF